MGRGWSLRRFFLPSLPSALGVLCLALVQADFLLGATTLSQRLVDAFVSSGGAVAANEGATALISKGLADWFSSRESLGWLIAGAICLAILGECLGLLTGQWRFAIAQQFRGRLQSELVTALLRGTGSNRLGNDVATAQAMFSSDSGALGMLLIFGLLGFLEQLVKLAVYVAGLCRLADGEGWKLAAVLVPSAFVFKVVVMRLFLRLEQRASERSNESMLQSHRAALGFFPLMARLVYLKGEGSISKRLLSAAEAGSRDNQRYQMVGSIHGSVAGLLTILALPFAALMMLNMDVSPGAVIQGQALFGAVISVVGALISFPGQFVHYGPALARVTDALAIPDPGQRPDELDALRGGSALSIRVTDLSFKYDPEGISQLDGMSFEIPPGALVCMVGSSGSGKSTLARLLMGECRPESGTIEIGGVDSTDWHLWWRRELIAFLPAEVGFLSGDSLTANLAFGRDELDPGCIESVARSCGLERVLDSYGSAPIPMPERQLSTGEQRRCGVARLLLGGQPIWILDEPISNLDPATMREVAGAIQQAAKGRTTLVVTHDPEFFDSDFNLFLCEGKLGGVGSHQMLLETCPRYREIYERRQAPECDGALVGDGVPR